MPTIIESVHSICRDGTDTPISLNKSNGSELPNADVLSLFRQTTCSESASIHFCWAERRRDRAGGDGGAGRAFALPLFGGPYRI